MPYLTHRRLLLFREIILSKASFIWSYYSHTWFLIMAKQLPPLEVLHKVKSQQIRIGLEWQAFPLVCLGSLSLPFSDWLWESGWNWKTLKGPEKVGWWQVIEKIETGGNQARQSPLHGFNMNYCFFQSSQAVTQYKQKLTGYVQRIWWRTVWTRSVQLGNFKICYDNSPRCLCRC